VFGFGLTTATALQRDVCRVAEGKQPLSAEGRRALAADRIEGRPDELCIVSGVRAAKSIIAGVIGVHASQHCDVSLVRPGEMPRFSIVSERMDLARVIFGHLRGAVMGRPALRALLVSEPTADAVILRHPSGTPIEVKVVAGSRAGSTLVARWSAGVVFDEAPRMLGSGEGVVNLDDARNAIRGRLLPGAQIIEIGSPWAPWGPVFDLVRDHHGKPTSKIVVMRAPAYEMNPIWWTPERCAALRESDPDAYQTDVEANFRAAQSGLFGGELDGAIQTGVTRLETDPRCSYVASIDPATRGNAWTLIVQTMIQGVRHVVLAKQWRGSKQTPLDAGIVFRDIAAALAPYRVTTVASDQWSYDALRGHAMGAGLHLRQLDMTDREQTERWLALRSEMVAGKRRILDESELIADLRRLVKRTTHTGLTIDMPLTSDGRHCDYAPALMRCEAQFIEDQRGNPPDAAALAQAEVEKMRASALKSIQPPRGRGGFRR